MAARVGDKLTVTVRYDPPGHMRGETYAFYMERYVVHHGGGTFFNSLSGMDGCKDGAC